VEVVGKLLQIATKRRRFADHFLSRAD